MQNHPFGVDSGDHDDLKRAAEDPTRFHICGDMNRIGVQLFMTKLEYTHYPPRSGKNHLFEFRILKWPDDFLMYWVIASIPIEDRAVAELLIPECGLRLVNGVPVMLGGKDCVFPMEGDRVWCLENSKDHPIYSAKYWRSNNQEVIGKLRAEQDAEIEKIIHNDIEKMRKELCNQGLSEVQIERVLAQWHEGNENYMENPE